jgi:hypothetical protein
VNCAEPPIVPLRDRVFHLARLLLTMPPAEAAPVVEAFIGRAMSTRSQTERRRKEALQAVLARYPRPWSTKTAAAAALDLSEYALTSWAEDRERGGAPPGDSRRQALFGFMLANNGATLGRTSIWNIGIAAGKFDSEKSPDF